MKLWACACTDNGGCVPVTSAIARQGYLQSIEKFFSTGISMGTSALDIF